MRSTFTYERLAQKELNLPEETGDVETLARLEQENQEFLRRHPPEALTPAPRRVRFPTALVTAAALLFVVGLATQLAPRGAGEDTRVKSAAQTLMVYHKTAGGSELLSPAARLGQGDEVQFAFRAPEHRYAAIISVDGRGTVTTHLPLSGREAPEVVSTVPELLPYSYRLDDAPNFEAIVLVTSPEPFDLALVQPFVKAWAGRTGQAPTLPAEFESTVFRITKKETSR